MECENIQHSTEFAEIKQLDFRNNVYKLLHICFIFSVVIQKTNQAQSSHCVGIVIDTPFESAGDVEIKPMCCIENVRVKFMAQLHCLECENEINFITYCSYICVVLAHYSFANI